MNTRVQFGLVASLVVAALAFPAMSWSGPVRVKTTSTDRWNPGFQHVVPGTRVVWVNPERHDQRHDLTAYGGNWSKSVTLAPGERTGKRFDREGTYEYFCRLHGDRSDGECRGMCGVIHVAR